MNPETDWRGKVWAIRQLPRHWTLEDPDAWRDGVRACCWLVVKSIVGAAAIILLYAIARGA